MKLSRISSIDVTMKKSTKKNQVINLNFELWLYIYIFSQFSMEISKQNYLIGQQIFPTVCYLTCFFHLHNATYGNGYKFPEFFVRGRFFITLPRVAKVRQNKDQGTSLNMKISQILKFEQGTHLSLKSYIACQVCQFCDLNQDMFCTKEAFLRNTKKF